MSDERLYYHITLSRKSTLPARMIVCLPNGGTVRFDKTETDKTSTSYPRKQAWLNARQALDLKLKGFTVRKAKQPAPDLPKPRRRKPNGDV